MLTVFRAVRCSCAPGQAVASVGTGSVEESSQRAAYGSPEKNTTMRARPCNVLSLWVSNYQQVFYFITLITIAHDEVPERVKPDLMQFLT
jgi:hypothetical protein